MVSKMTGKVLNKIVNIKISIAKPEDVREIQDVFYLAWLDTYPNQELGITVDDIENRFKDRFSPQKIEKRIEQIRNIYPNHRFLVAKEDEKIVGVCSLAKYDDYNQLQAIYVLPGYQRHGIGMMFWQIAQTFFAHDKDTIVWVANYNLKAIEFYKRLGFKEIENLAEEEKIIMKSGAIIHEIKMILPHK